jgi:hypothetical protein
VLYFYLQNVRAEVPTFPIVFNGLVTKLVPRFLRFVIPLSKKPGGVTGPALGGT